MKNHDLLERFAKMRDLRGKSYSPRTKHLNADGLAQYTNRLFLESSPYLLQHAHNPVNWYPWGNEAFEVAVELNRPILLSIGYSTCHWCHVMEEESFEDLEIAQFLNDNYVCIKVDREERPEVDGIYMAAVQALTGHGGWPMTVWLAQDRRPFFGGTYFPPRDGDRGTRSGFLTILKYLKAEFDKNPAKIAEAATQVTSAVQEALTVSSDEVPLSVEVLKKAAAFYKARFDTINGGITGAPKFPSSLPLRFLLNEYRRSGDKELLEMVVLTLKQMAAGGIYDQAGGGFHRYSTDENWLVPHFEKMLYDNALLVVAYLEAYQITKNEDFERIVREVLRYLDRDMTSPEGALYSATDADSKDERGESHEGYFFTWSKDELAALLPSEMMSVAEEYLGVSAHGNFEGRNILVAAKAPSKEATQAKELLYEARKKKPGVLRDEKILTAWNGLAISALAKAGFVLNDESYVTRAATAADFVLSKLQDNMRLLRSYMDGQARHAGYLEDYAFFIAGLLDLFEATSDLRWLKEAIRLDRVLCDEFEDAQDGGFFMTSVTHEKLIAREKPAYDGAEPSGNSVALLNLLRLAELTSDESYKKRAGKALSAFSMLLTQRPTGLSQMLLALDIQAEGAQEIVVVTPLGKRAEAAPFLDELRNHFQPNKVFLVVEEGSELVSYAQHVPWLSGKVAQGGKPTAYVCRNYVCGQPTTDPKVFASQLLKA